jgi:hypothetical protein
MTTKGSIIPADDKRNDNNDNINNSNGNGKSKVG